MFPGAPPPRNGPPGGLLDRPPPEGLPVVLGQLPPARPEMKPLLIGGTELRGIESPFRGTLQDRRFWKLLWKNASFLNSPAESEWSHQRTGNRRTNISGRWLWSLAFSTNSTHARHYILVEEALANTREVLTAFSARYPGTTFVMETGTHSPWVSRLVAALGHPVIVANARKLRAISQSQTKSDREDAQMSGQACPKRHRIRNSLTAYRAAR